jgi:malate synthase
MRADLGGSHAEVTKYFIKGRKLAVSLESGSVTGLVDNAQFKGFKGDKKNPSSILLVNNGLHVEICHRPGPPDRLGRSGRRCRRDHRKRHVHHHGLRRLVAAVDADDKTVVYRNWLGLMKGDLKDTFEKGGKTVTRELVPHREYTGANGKPLSAAFPLAHAGAQCRSADDHRRHSRPERQRHSRNPDGCAGQRGHRHARRRAQRPLRQLAARLVYVVVPKLHGPKEVALVNQVYTAIENASRPQAQHREDGHHGRGAPHHGQPQGVHPRCQRPCVLHQHRLPRPHRRRDPHLHGSRPDDQEDRHEASTWIDAYENWNVDVGLECGLPGHAQIGKGMWAMPDMMAAMLEQKIGHPQAGANTAWVPSPTAATLHATHYHKVNVRTFRTELRSRQQGKA